ncbi:MAG TPA: glycosyltransferase family 1 protein [Longimicrobiales bacterium]
MKIGVNGRFYGAAVTGVQRFAREVAARLFGRADDLVLFLPRGVEPPAGLDARVRVVRGTLAGRTWEHLELPWRMRAERCGALLNLANVAPLVGGPHVLVLHDVLAITNPEWFSRRFAAWYRFAQGRWARRAARVATVSGWVRDEAARVLGLDPDLITVVAQGIEPFDRPASPEAIRVARQRWALPDTYLLAVAGGDPRKNVRFLLRMLARWRGMRGVAPTLIVVGGSRPAVHGYASGRGPDAGGYDEAEIRAAGDVRFLGRVDDEDLRTLYTAATVFCFPSEAEGFGRPPLEAMGCGTPVVVAPYGPAHEVLGGVAPIIELETGRWIQTLERLLRSPEERRALAEAGRRHALRYRWDATADALLALCREVAGAPEAEVPAPVPLVQDAAYSSLPAAPEPATPEAAAPETAAAETAARETAGPEPAAAETGAPGPGDAPPAPAIRRRRRRASPGSDVARRRPPEERAASPGAHAHAREEPPEEA